LLETGLGPWPAGHAHLGEHRLAADARGAHQERAGRVERGTTTSSPTRLVTASGSPVSIDWSIAETLSVDDAVTGMRSPADAQDVPHDDLLERDSCSVPSRTIRARSPEASARGPRLRCVRVRGVRATARQHEADD
jgi:hypothetical protein